MTLFRVDARPAGSSTPPWTGRMTPPSPHPQAGFDDSSGRSRYAAFAVACGVAPEAARRAAGAVGANLPLPGPDDQEALLAPAGFAHARLFHAGLAFRGWVARA